MEPLTAAEAIARTCLVHDKWLCQKISDQEAVRQMKEILDQVEEIPNPSSAEIAADWKLRGL